MINSKKLPERCIFTAWQRYSQCWLSLDRWLFWTQTGSGVVSNHHYKPGPSPVHSKAQRPRSPTATRRAFIRFCSSRYCTGMGIFSHLTKFSFGWWYLNVLFFFHCLLETGWFHSIILFFFFFSPFTLRIRGWPWKAIASDLARLSVVQCCPKIIYLSKHRIHLLWFMGCVWCQQEHWSQ